LPGGVAAGPPLLPCAVLSLVRGGAGPGRQAALAGAAPQNRLKFTFGLLIGVHESEKVCSQFTFSLQTMGKSLHCYQKKFASEVTKQQKKIYIDAKKVYIVAKKVRIFEAKVCKKFTSFIKK
jgi:hypothetical protein